MDCLPALHFILRRLKHTRARTVTHAGNIHTACSSLLPPSVTFTTLIETYTQVARALNANAWVRGQISEKLTALIQLSY